VRYYSKLSIRESSSMIRSKRVVAGLVLAALGSALAQAQTSIDVAKITCDQYVLYKITDPRNIAIWLSGYHSAKRGDTVIEVQQLEENAKKVTDFCRANPKVRVMEAVEKVLKPNR
jgi:acid stress chaperone HdeB